jgi:hypothetical protein
MKGRIGRIIGFLLFILSVGVYYSFAENTTGWKPQPPVPFDGMEMSFHGRRMFWNSDDFYVRRILITEKDNGMMELQVSFNVPLDPDSFAYEQMQINNDELDKTATIKFSRAGNTFLIRFPVKDKKKIIYSIDFPEMKSFDKQPLKQRHFGDIMVGVEFVYENRTDMEDTDAESSCR